MIPIKQSEKKRYLGINLTKDVHSFYGEKNEVTETVNKTKINCAMHYNYIYEKGWK